MSDLVGNALQLNIILAGWLAIDHHGAIVNDYRIMAIFLILFLDLLNMRPNVSFHLLIETSPNINGFGATAVRNVIEALDLAMAAKVEEASAVSICIGASRNVAPALGDMDLVFTCGMRADQFTTDDVLFLSF